MARFRCLPWGRPFGTDDDLASQRSVSSREESPKGSGVTWGNSGEHRLASGEQGERVMQQGTTEPSTAATRPVEFDAYLTPSGQAVGQCDKAALISEDADIVAQSLGMTNTRVVIDIKTFRQARRSRRATRNEHGVDTIDPALAACQVPEKVRSQRGPVAVGSLGLDLGGGQGSGDDGVSSEGDRALQPARQRGRTVTWPSAGGKCPSAALRNIPSKG